MRRPIVMHNPPIATVVPKRSGHRLRCLSSLALMVLLAASVRAAAPAYIVAVGGKTSIVVTDEHAATGKQSLKFTDSATAPRVGHPVLYVKPQFRARGRAMFSCDIMLEKGAVAGIQFRTQSNARKFPVGPTITFRGGTVVATGKRNAMAYSPGTWLTVRVVLHLDGSARYDLELGLRDGEMREFTDLPCQSPEFKQCGVIVIMSPGRAGSAFFVDNLLIKELD